MTIKNALVVDDSKSARMMLQRLLSKINVQAEAVDSAEAALTFLESSQPDVIFMDHMMPGMDGLEATRKIRSFEKENNLPAVPLVAVTANAFEEDRQQSLDAGCTAFLVKPIRKADMFQCVARAVGRIEA